MTTSDAFFESWVNVPHTVLNRQLKPLCLLHLLWLHHIGSPLVQTDKPTTLADLETAVAVCSSQSSEEILQRLRDISLLKRLWKLWTRKANLKAEILKFVNYYTDYLSLPQFEQRTGQQETENKIPWLLYYASALIKHTGWTEQQVFLMPIGKVYWFNITFDYLVTGETNIVSDKKLAAMEAFKAMQAAALTAQP